MRDEGKDEMVQTQRNNFTFYCPLEIAKSGRGENDEEIMLLGGIASTADEDADGEFLDPKGFDIRPLLESGMVNWHHQAKTSPATIVGEPTKAEIKKEGLYIETLLYPSSSIARDIWELAKTLDKDSKSRRLGYSIEGKVLERESNDASSKGYKKITKAVITGVAITHMPKNPKTFANIIKGEIDDLEDEEDKDEETKVTTDNVQGTDEDKKDKDGSGQEEKSLDTTEGRPLIREQLDPKVKVLTFGKSLVFERIFQDIPGISIEKAKRIYSLIQNIADMENRKNVTDEDIRKAYEALGLDISKADDDPNDMGTEGDDDLKKKGCGGAKKGDNVADDEEEDDDDLIEDEEEEEEEEEDDEEPEEEEEEEEETKSKAKGLKKAFDPRFNRLEKALATSHLHTTRYIKALGVMVKDASQRLQKATDSLNLANDKIEELTDMNKAQEETIDRLEKALKAFGDAVPAPRSLRNAAAVERNFNRAGEEAPITKAGESTGFTGEVSIRNKRAISEILDQATFSKGGFDQAFSKATMGYEANGTLPKDIVARLQMEYGITITE